MTARPHLFLSYGVRDATAFAERLHRDLTARGFEVWQDVHNLRAGYAWSEDIQAGIRSCQVLLAILSPHAVRRSETPGNPTQTDSVCLDEIEYARFGCHIPILPIKALPCEVPFLVHRLQYIDLTRWQESEAEYQNGLDRVCDAVRSVLAGRSIERSWDHLLEPWDFELFLREKRQDFTGRGWFFAELDEWRINGAEPALLITGEPGVGKSAIVATLVHDNPAGQVLAYHCCRADTPATLNPAIFVRSLAAMLSGRLDLYGPMLADPTIASVLDDADRDPASAFEVAILNPLSKLTRQGQTRYLLIDALDEAVTRPGRPTIVEVLATRLDYFPEWLRLVATTRSDPVVLRQLRGLRARELSPQDDRNQDDVRHFIQRRLTEPSLKARARAGGQTDAAVVESLLTASAGNFLFVSVALKAVERGQLSFHAIDRLPPGLDSLYQIFFHRLFEAVGVDFGASRQVLETIAVAREPLTRRQIAEATNLEEELDLPPLLARLAPFLPARDSRYALFHKSLFDWLTGWDTHTDQPIAGQYALSVQRGRRRLTDWCWTEYKGGPEKASIYCLKHLPTHLHDVGRHTELRRVLLDFTWLRAKLNATDASALLADYDQLPDDNDLATVQSALRLSVHVILEDRNQLAGQLIGRLSDYSGCAIAQLVSAAKEWQGVPWLKPITSSLASPNGPLLRTIEGHAEDVTALGLSPCGSFVISASALTIHVCDISAKAPTLALRGHTNSIHAVHTTLDGKLLISLQANESSWKAVDNLRIWSLETGAPVCRHTVESPYDTPVILGPDGQSVLTSIERIVTMWSLLDGHKLRAFAPCNSPISAMILTSEEQYLVSGHQDGQIVLSELATGKPVHSFLAHEDAITSLALLPSKHLLVSGSKDKTIRTWDLTAATAHSVLRGHTDEISSVAIAKNGRDIFSASHDGTIRCWNVETGTQEVCLRGHTHAVKKFMTSADGRRAVSTGSALRSRHGDHSVKVWDLDRAMQMEGNKGHRNYVTDVLVHPSGKWVISCSTENTIRIRDTSSGKQIHLLSGHQDGVKTIAAIPNDHRIVSASWDGTLRVWDVIKGKELGRLAGHEDGVYCLAVSFDGHHLVSGSLDSTVRVWDLTTYSEVVTLRGHKDTITEVLITDDGQKVLSHSDDRKVKLWNIRTGEVHTWNSPSVGHNRNRALASDHSVRRVVFDSGFVLDIEEAVGEPWISEGLKTALQSSPWGRVQLLSISADGMRAVLGGRFGNFIVWDFRLDAALLHFDKQVPWHRGVGGDTHKDDLTAAVMTPDGRYVATASEDGTLKYWDLSSRLFIAGFRAESRISCLSLSADGLTIAAGEYTGEVHVLRVEGLSSNP